MLENQVLAIGLSQDAQEKLELLKGNYIIIRLESAAQVRPSHLRMQALIVGNSVAGDSLVGLGESFPRENTVGVGEEPCPIAGKQLPTNFKVADLEAHLAEVLPDVRPVRKDVGELSVGKIVKNKVFPTWGLGVVTKVLGPDMVEVTYTKPPKQLKTKSMSCHKTQLRIICDIEEIRHDEAS